MRLPPARLIVSSLLLLLLVFISLISLNKIHPFWDGLVFSTFFLGGIGWLVTIGSLLYIGRDYQPQLLFLFLCVFCFSFWRGPFLEPPADTFEHLKRIHCYCDTDSGHILVEDTRTWKRNSVGLWHYSMSSFLVCRDPQGSDPASVVRRIDITHAFFVSLILSCLFILAKKASLPDHWAFLSCLIAFLFMGTNRFSFFSYYSLSPSFTSIMLYWFWVTLFFFRRKKKDILKGLGLASLIMPIIWVNHRQEAVFLGFVVIIWLVLNAYFASIDRIQKGKCTGVGGRYFKKNFSLHFTLLFCSVLFFIVFVLPQLSAFREFLCTFFVNDEWQENQRIVVKWNGLFLWGKIWGFRVKETFFNIAILLIALALPYFYRESIQKNMERKVRIYILAILPLLGYILPLFHFIWLSNVKYFEYYRLCYSSFFWLFIADFFYETGESAYCMIQGKMLEGRKC